MYCSKCGAQNADTDAFCGQCGAKLSAASPTGAPGGDGQGAIPTPPPVMDSRAEFAMLRPPEAEMRPLTKVAYDIHDSDQGPVVGSMHDCQSAGDFRQDEQAHPVAPHVGRNLSQPEHL